MMINEMKNSRSSDLLPMFYDCKYFFMFPGARDTTRQNIKVTQDHARSQPVTKTKILTLKIGSSTLPFESAAICKGFVAILL